MLEKNKFEQRKTKLEKDKKTKLEKNKY